MNRSKTNYFTAGLAIFAMFFGAGNIIFPLALGRVAAGHISWALFGLLLTAVVMPLAGLLAMFRYQGQVRLFFSRLGNVPGLLIASLIIALLGPFGAAPRCIALAHSTMSILFPNISLLIFSAVACGLIFFFAYRENQLLKLLGNVLSPLKISLLVWIIIKGFIEAPQGALQAINLSEPSYFWHGLTEGYNTMDLLAAFFFAPIIITSLGNPEKDGQLNSFVLKASALGAALLSVIYIGFCFLAYAYAPQLEGVPNDQLLGAVAIHILGPHAGFIVGLTVTIACLTTAIALIAAFANFIHKEILKEKISSAVILLLSLLTTFLITTLEFRGIAQFLTPILKICYPILILLTVYNLLMPLHRKVSTS